MARGLKANDVLELSKLYQAEFNKPELHDRVLVFDVMRDGWERSAVLISSLSNESEQESQTSEEERPEDQDLASVVLDAKQNEAKNTDSDELTEGVVVDNEEPRQDVVETVCEIVSDTGSLSDTKEDNANDQAVDKIDTTTSVVSNPETASNEISILRQHRFFVHSSWLALQSSYFQSLFFSGMRESNFKEVHVKISECEEKAHLQLFEAMYKPDILDEVGVDELLTVLELADKYDVRFVFRKCKYALQATRMSLQICEKIMLFIKIEHTLTDVEDLAATLQTFLAKTFSPLDKTWQTKSFENLSEPSVRYLLSSDRLRTQSENTVFHALMHWVECNDLCTASSCSNTPLLSVIRFEVIPIDYLHNVVQYHPIATKMADFNGLYLKGVTYHALTREMKERLTVKPVSRDPIQEEIVQYTWVIPGDEVEEFVSSSKILTSDIFWCCGYSMQLYLMEQSKMASIAYRAVLCLKVIGLRNESFLPVKWTWTCKAIFPSSSKDCHHTFSVELPKALVPVQFKWKSDVPKTQAVTEVTGLFGSGLFSGPSTTTPLFQSTGNLRVGAVAASSLTSTTPNSSLFSGKLPSTTGFFGPVSSLLGGVSTSTPEPVVIPAEPKTLQSLSIEVKISLDSENLK